MVLSILLAFICESSYCQQRLGKYTFNKNQGSDLTGHFGEGFRTSYILALNISLFFFFPSQL